MRPPHKQRHRSFGFLGREESARRTVPTLDLAKSPPPPPTDSSSLSESDRSGPASAPTTPADRTQPPCPMCQSTAKVVELGLWDVSMVYYCGFKRPGTSVCGNVFVPGMGRGPERIVFTYSHVEKRLVPMFQ
jgi:hypothetical protein